MFGTHTYFASVDILIFFMHFFPSDLCRQFYDCHFELLACKLLISISLNSASGFYVEHIPISSFLLTFCVDFYVR